MVRISVTVMWRCLIIDALTFPELWKMGDFFQKVDVLELKLVYMHEQIKIPQ